MIRKVPLRLALAVFPLLLLGIGIVEWVRQEPVVQVGQGGRALVTGALPFWAAVCLAIGFVVLVLVLAVGDLKDMLKWSSPFLFLLWVLQFTLLGGITVLPEDPRLAQPVSWTTRYTWFNFGWWGLALLVVMVIVIAVGSRMRTGSQGRAR